jgi:uncharacterized protein YqfA (UPF0365 family)
MYNFLDFCISFIQSIINTLKVNPLITLAVVFLFVDKTLFIAFLSASVGFTIGVVTGRSDGILSTFQSDEEAVRELLDEINNRPSEFYLDDEETDNWK